MNRRLAAAKRAIKRQKERYSLFDALGIAVQEGYVDESPEARIEKIDSGWKEWERQMRASRLGNIRLGLRSVKPEYRATVKKFWRERGGNGIPDYPDEYFLSFVHRHVVPEWKEFDAMAVLRAQSEERIEKTKVRLWE